MPTTTIQTDTPGRRALLAAAGLFLLVLLFFAAKWFFGNAISTRVFYKEVADLAVSLAPDDPQTHYAAGVIYERSFEPADLPRSLGEYERAVALSPHDHRLWTAYGRALERSGEPEKAEKALRRAIELAPNYADVRWTYGNILLRREKYPEAFAEIRRAVAADQKYAAPAAAAAWDVFEGDLARIKKNVGDSAPVRSALAVSLAGQKRFAEALGFWEALPAGRKQGDFRADGEKIYEHLIGAQRYRAALRVRSGFDEETKQRSAVGRITDGGFEGRIDPEKPFPFGWVIGPGERPRIGVSLEHRREGGQSLAIAFSSPTGRDFRPVAQTVAVESGRAYEFEAFYRSDLDASATLRWEIVDAAGGEVLATTEAVEPEAAGWRRLTARFETPETGEGVIVRLVREECTSADCSINGTVWFDALKLE